MTTYAHEDLIKILELHRLWWLGRDGGKRANLRSADLRSADLSGAVLTDGEEQQEYTCKHFDGDAGLCTIYDRRPLMCSQYPDYGRGDACVHCGFTNPKRAECTKAEAA